MEKKKTKKSERERMGKFPLHPELYRKSPRSLPRSG
jgi:hypothetical protein